MAKTRQQLSVLEGKETRRSTRQICRKNHADDEASDESETESASYSNSQSKSSRKNADLPTSPHGGKRILQIVDTIYCEPIPPNNHMVRHREHVEMRMEGENVRHRHHTRSLEQRLNGTPGVGSYQNGHIPHHRHLRQLTDTGVRRSTRRRKFIYDNLNQSWLLATGMPDFSKLYADKHDLEVEDADSNPVGGKDNDDEKPTNYECLDESNQDFDDMYSRVKRVRRQKKFYDKEMGHMADTEDNESTEDDDEATDIEEDVSQEEGATNGVPRHTKYSLRPKKPITERFQCPIGPTRPKRSAAEQLFHSPHHRNMVPGSFNSPVHRSPYLTRKRRATHNSSSTSSSSSEDERSFDRRKARSMGKARNRCLPLNMAPDDVSKGFLRERTKIGSSLADVDPMGLDKTVLFDKVGGLGEHIESLKEMILFPLMYPEVFEKFRIDPPRGVLFYGPPGTGKTLVARALANECSQGAKKVSFFMRKGADCLSKWVGESERQLRLLFDQAYTMRPSIIFFDEIDGLAPVRSTRQDQIHSSIVSTILALMDGLDNRGEIVVIGATNRVDAIDPALRRPGRFDREFHFPLPSLNDRKNILNIHTGCWQPPLPEPLLTELSVKTVGYCGADIKSLCAEAALTALKRCFPQIYKSSQKLQLNITSIQIQKEDFERAMAKIVPAGHRATPSPARPLNPYMKPLLQRMLLKAIGALRLLYPIGLKHSSYELTADSSTSGPAVSSLVDEDAFPEGLMDTNQNFGWLPSHRPRLLLAGRRDQAQTSHLAPSVLHCLEHLPVHRLDLPNLYSVTCRSPEEACAQVFREAVQKVPCVLYLPHVGQWWDTVGETVRVTLITLLHDMNPSMPILFLATSDCVFVNLPLQVKELFQGRGELLESNDPTDVDRRMFFANILKQVLIPPKKVRKASLRPLPLAPPPEPRKLTEEELERLRLKEESTLRELRLFLRDIVNKLARDRRFAIFNKPVDPGEVPDYLEVIATPMDLETIMSKIDLHQYENVTQFLTDINLICHNALEYNPDRDPADKLIRHRACLFKDTAHALIDNQLDEEFSKMCHEISSARKLRGESPSKFAPKNYHVLPRNCTIAPQQQQKGDGEKENDGGTPTVAAPATRFSRRLRSLEASPPSSDTEEASPVQKQPEPPRVVQEAKPTFKAYEVIRKRKRKGPWFGCRNRLIRRPLHVGLPAKPARATATPAVETTPDTSLETETNQSKETNNASPEPVSSDPEVTLRMPRNFSPQDAPTPQKSSSEETLTQEQRDLFEEETEEEVDSSRTEERLTVNTQKLDSLEDKFVATTARFTVEMLERLQVMLQQCLIKHCRSWNKDLLLEELETEVDTFVKHVKRSI